MIFYSFASSLYYICYRSYKLSTVVNKYSEETGDVKYAVTGLEEGVPRTLVTYKFECVCEKVLKYDSWKANNYPECVTCKCPEGKREK